MKKIFSIISVIIILPLYFQGQSVRDTYYTVVDVYTDPDIVEGESIHVYGYYTNDDYDYLIYFYGDFEKDRPFAPHTILTLTGIDPPAEAYNGGYIDVTGTVTFAPRSEPYNPEDSLMAFLDASAITVFFPGESFPGPPGGGVKEKNQIQPEENRLMNNRSCDPCMFAFLLSGGANVCILS